MIYYKIPNKSAVLKLGLLISGLIWMCDEALAQCQNKIEILSGSQQIACTEVTVTSAGDAGNGFGCTGGPYEIGLLAMGSYTFTFSPPVSGVTLDFARLDNHDFLGFGHEEVSIDINGAHYFLTDIGSISCDPLQVEINANGDLQCPDCGDPNCLAACEGLQINQTITSIKITDKFFVQPQAGIFFSIFFCCAPCLVDAGVIQNDPLNLCPGQQATVPSAEFTFLPAGNILQYILFSDPTDTLGSILATSNTPSFSFNPSTMHENTTYYIASIAGENLNGNVDPNGFCLDFSNAIEVIWWAKPTVSFSVANPGVCPGECTTVTANFTGTPPFNLTYKTNLGSPVTADFLDNMGTFEICIPHTASPGNLNLQATALTDSHCTCN